MKRMLMLLLCLLAIVPSIGISESVSYGNNGYTTTISSPPTGTRGRTVISTVDRDGRSTGITSISAPMPNASELRSMGLGEHGYFNCPVIGRSVTLDIKGGKRYHDLEIISTNNNTIVGKMKVGDNYSIVSIPVSQLKDDDKSRLGFKPNSISSTRTNVFLSKGKLKK